MSWESHPLTPERFEDFADVINPNRRATHCWCLSHRLRAKDIEELGGAIASRRCGGSASGRTRRGWSPTSTAHRSAGATSGRGPRSHAWMGRSSSVPSTPCRSGASSAWWSGEAIARRASPRTSFEGAVDYAASRGAPAVEAYPVDPEGRMDTTMAFVGTRAMFERVGFEIIGTTDAVASKLPRLIMRRSL